MGALPRRARERHRRRPGRHDQGGHPPGGDGGHARPHPARLRRQRDPRRRPLLQPEAHRPARRAVVPDAVPRHADQGDARGRRADGRRAHRGLQPARSGSASATRSASCAPATSYTFALKRDDERHAGRTRRNQWPTGFRGAIFDVDGVLVDSPHERAWREALAELMETQWSDIRAETTLVARALHAAGLPAGHVRQAALQRRAGGARVLRACPTPRARSNAVRRPQADDGDRAHRGGRVHRLPRRAALHHRGQGRRDPRRRGFVLQERRAVPAQDPPRHVRAGERARVRAS